MTVDELGTLVIRLHHPGDKLVFSFGDLKAEVIYQHKKGNQVILVIKAPKEVKIDRAIQKIDKGLK